MNKKILFRADGNEHIGLGHLYRVFAMCEMLKNNFEFIVLTRESTTIEVIPSAYKVKLIPNSIALEDEPLWINNLFPKADYSVIADGYQFNEAYQYKLKQFGFYLIYVDDFAENHMVSDVVINHSALVSDEMYSKEIYTKLALGTPYAMLRPIFLEAAKSKQEVKPIKDVFVCFGGADFNNLSLKVAQALLNVNKQMVVHLVLGNAYKNEEIITLSQKYPNIILYRNLDETNIFDLMKKCQLAIAPCSTISYELCCVGIPLISGYYIDNQLNLYKGLLRENVFYDGGDLKKQTTFNLEKLIQNVLESPLIDLQEKVNNQFDLFNKNQKEAFRNLIN